MLLENAIFDHAFLGISREGVLPPITVRVQMFQIEGNVSDEEMLQVDNPDSSGQLGSPLLQLTPPPLLPMLPPSVEMLPASSFGALVLPQGFSGQLTEFRGVEIFSANQAASENGVEGARREIELMRKS